MVTVMSRAALHAAGQGSARRVSATPSWGVASEQCAIQRAATGAATALLCRALGAYSCPSTLGPSIGHVGGPLRAPNTLATASSRSGMLQMRWGTLTSLVRDSSHPTSTPS
jgi:hypothetical protein